MLKSDQRILQVMRERGLDALLAASADNVYYSSGWLATMGHTIIGRFPSFVLLTPDNLAHPTIIVPGADLGFVFDGSLSEESKIQPFGEFYLAMPRDNAELTNMAQAIRDRLTRGPIIKDRAEAIARTLQEAGVAEGHIGIDEVGLPDGLYDRLTATLPKAKFELASQTFLKIRSVKTPEEVRRLRKALSITETAILETLQVAREGVTENDLARTLEVSMVNQGARPLFTMISFGSRAATGLWTSDERLKRGDMIKYDVGCTYQGYKSDTAFMASFGQPSARVEQCFNAVRAGAERVTALLKPGVRPPELLAAGVAAVQEAGLRPFGRQHAGHGIGISVYDDPLLTASNEMAIEEGMVLNVELPYYEIGLGGFNVEETVVVGRDGVQQLKTLKRELYVLD